MAKLLIFSDLHLQESSAQTCLTILNEIPKQAMAYGCKEIGFLGDWWHTRYELPVLLLNLVKDILIDWHVSYGLKTWLLVGNHDAVNVQGVNALEIFDHLPGVSVISKPIVNDWGLWVPYCHSKDTAQSVFAAHRGADTVFFHGAICGALMNGHYVNTDGIEAKELGKFKRILLGHYHLQQDIGHASYIGSPWQTRADEAGQQKGFAVWDGNQLKRVQQQWGPRFFNVDAVDENIDLNGVHAGDTLRITVEDEKLGERISSKLVELGIKPVIEIRREQNKSRLQLAKNATYLEYVKAFIETAGADLNKDALLEKFLRLSNEVL